MPSMSKSVAEDMSTINASSLFHASQFHGPPCPSSNAGSVDAMNIVPTRTSTIAVAVVVSLSVLPFPAVVAGSPIRVVTMFHMPSGTAGYAHGGGVAGTAGIDGRYSSKRAARFSVGRCAMIRLVRSACPVFVLLW